MMETFKRTRFKPLSLILFLTILLAVMLAVYAIPTIGALSVQQTVYLGSAKSFGVLAGSGITNTGATTISGTAGGDVGLSPTTGAAITGFGTVTASGTIYAVDAAGPAGSVMNPALLTQAKNDLTAAYIDAAGRTSDETITANLGGRTLTPGVYTSGSSIDITGTLTLDGENNPNAVFIFRAGSTLTTAVGSNINLINGAQACRIFWQVGSSATLGTDSYFVGHILALESITANTGAEVKGQLLARNGAVTLQANTITNDLCLPAGTLTVTKVVAGDTTGIVLPLFEITVTGPGGFTATKTFVNNESFTWSNLVSGDYTITESRTSLSSRWAVSGEGTLPVAINQTVSRTITNTYTPPTSSSPISSPTVAATGSLTVLKVVAGDTTGITLPSFEITVTGPEGFLATKTFVYNESYTWDNLVPGAYTVTENKTGLSSLWAVSGEGAVQVTANDTALTTITNLYSPPVEPIGSLTVAKIVTGDIGDMTLPLFRITVTGPEGFLATRTFVHNESFTWSNLVPGTYTVTENRTGLSSLWTVSGEGAVQVAANQIGRATITNSYETSEVIPQTGQETDYRMAMFFGSIAVMLAGAGIILANKRKKLNA